MPGSSPGMTPFMLQRYGTNQPARRGPTYVTLLDRQGIDRRADAAGDRDRGRDEQELVGLVGGAVLAELLQLEDLAHGHAHDRDGDPVPGLVDAVLALVRPHLAAPGVGGERRKLGALDPLQGLEGEARRVAARIAVPAAELLAALHLAGAHDHVIAALELDLLRLGAIVEVLAGDAIAVVEA